MGAYGGLAAALVAAWTRWPTATVLVLLAAAATHFGISDTNSGPSTAAPRRAFAVPRAARRRRRNCCQPQLARPAGGS